MFELETEHHIDAAHHLVGYQGQCANVHGHRWKVICTFAHPIRNELGMVLDFKEIKEDVDVVLRKFDHHDINQVLPSDFNPTAENLAYFLFNAIKLRLPWLVKVKVYETPECAAVYYEIVNVGNVKGEGSYV